MCFILIGTVFDEHWRYEFFQYYQRRKYFISEYIIKNTDKFEERNIQWFYVTTWWKYNTINFNMILILTCITYIMYIPHIWMLQAPFLYTFNVLHVSFKGADNSLQQQQFKFSDSSKWFKVLKHTCEYVLQMYICRGNCKTIIPL